MSTGSRLQCDLEDLFRFLLDIYDVNRVANLFAARPRGIRVQGFPGSWKPINMTGRDVLRV